LPLALAAFVAGLAIGESPVAIEARQRLAPLRDVFAVLFFVSIGTLIDPAALPHALSWLGILAGLIVFAKVGPIYALARLAHPDGVRPACCSARRRRAVSSGRFGMPASPRVSRR
jgi:CPA2 family monovalent cation:H+ antiporter-2